MTHVLRRRPWLVRSRGHAALSASVLTGNRKLSLPLLMTAGNDRVGQVGLALCRVKLSAAAFLDREELHGCDAVMPILRESLSEKGQLVLMLGGKLLGKSFL